MKKVGLLFILVYFITFTQVGWGQTPPTLSSWSFESVTVSGTATSPTISSATADGGVLNGSSAVSGNHASASTVWSTTQGNGSTKAMNSNHWAQNDYLQFAFSTIGYTAINISWDQTGSNTGPKDFKVQYSINGGSSLLMFQVQLQITHILLPTIAGVPHINLFPQEQLI